MVNIILGLGLVLSLIGLIWCILAMRQLARALIVTNMSLNETRTLVASQEKRVKRIIKELESL